jgi:hypothetical protein
VRFLGIFIHFLLGRSVRPLLLKAFLSPSFTVGWLLSKEYMRTLFTHNHFNANEVSRQSVLVRCCHGREIPSETLGSSRDLLTEYLEPEEEKKKRECVCSEGQVK